MARLRGAACLLILILIFSAAPILSQQVDAQASPQARHLEYRFTVDKDGRTAVAVTYRDSAPGLGSMWLAVPKRSFAAWAMDVAEGRVTLQSLSGAIAGGTQMVFYDNLSIIYASPLEIHVEWNMSYGAFILEPWGFFLSPAICFESVGEAEAVLTLPPNTVRVEAVERSPRSSLGYTTLPGGAMLFTLTGENERIMVFFTVPGRHQRSVFTLGQYTVTTAPRYEGLARRVLSAYNSTRELLDNLFHVELGRVFAELYVPSTAEEISTGGFVPLSEDMFTPGNISLNIYYFRAEEGFIESVAIHELVHHYLAKAGLPISLLWVHEGLSNYVALETTQLLSLKGGEFLRESLLEQAERVSPGLYAYVEDWSPSPNPPFTNYAVSYRIFSELATQFAQGDEPFKGYNLYSRLFALIARLGVKVTTTTQFTALLSSASPNPEAVATKFQGWGFQVEAQPTLLTQPGAWLPQLLLAAVVLVLLLAALFTAERIFYRRIERSFLPISAFFDDI